MQAIHSLKKSLCILIPLALFGCGQARNTPQQALDQLRVALKDQKWDLLYDIMPVAEQKRWDAIVENFLLTSQKQGELLRSLGVDAGQATDLLRELKLTPEEWNDLPERERFARIFGHSSKQNLDSVGVNPEFVLNSKVKRETVSGDRAEIVVDDGKGHQPKLIFILEGEMWRFQLSGDEK